MFGAKPFSKFLHIYFRIRRGLTLGVRAVVRTPNGDFLLVRHTYIPGWHFPGGGVELGQAVETALADELVQETGIRVSGVAKLHGIFFNSSVSLHDHVVVYLCDTGGELPIKSKSFEIAELGYFAPERLPTDVDPGTERRIQEIAFSKSISCEW